MGTADNYLIAGDIILVRGKDLHRQRGEWGRWMLSAVISKLTHSEYTHAAMYIGHGKIIDVDVGRRVAVRQIDEIDEIDEIDCFDAYRVAEATNKDRQLAVYFCLTQRVRKYDYLAVVAIAYERLTGRVWPCAREDPRRWFCFELVARALRLSDTPWRVTGGEIANHKGVVLVHQSPGLVALF